MLNDPLIGAQLANFRIDRVLGRGGMATVYYGWDVRLERPVAIKVIDARYRENPAYTRRFLDEARAVAALRHENILQVHYADEQGGLHYFVMEYVRGPDLAQLLERYLRAGELMPIPDVMRIARAIAEALDYAHDSGVIHRDVKPSNVLVSEDGRVVLTDFGLAMNVERGTSGDVFGSPHYISPEQVRSSASAVRESDLYALGVVIYEMLAGEVPFDDENAVTLATMHVNDPAPPPSRFNPGLGAAVDAVFARALAKSPRDRYSSGRELVDAVEGALEDAAFGEATFIEEPDAGPAPTMPVLPDYEWRSEEPEPLRVSRTTMSEITAEYVSEHYPEDPAAPPLPGGIVPRPPLRRSPFRGRTRRYVPWLAGGGCVFIVTFIVAVLILASAANPGGGNSPRGTGEAATEPGETDEAENEQREEPGETTAPVNAGPPAPPLEEGDYHEAYYDDTSFYLKNLSGNDRPIEPIAFERLHNNGRILDRWEGWRWSEIYPTHEEGLCVVIEIINFLDHLDPEECEDRHVITRTPTLEEGEEIIFWTEEQGSKVFRVLWEDVEVARCDIKDGTCEFYLP